MQLTGCDPGPYDPNSEQRPASCFANQPARKLLPYIPVVMQGDLCSLPCPAAVSPIARPSARRLGRFSRPSLPARPPSFVRTQELFRGHDPNAAAGSSDLLHESRPTPQHPQHPQHGESSAPPPPPPPPPPPSPSPRTPPPPPPHAARTRTWRPRNPSSIRRFPPPLKNGFQKRKFFPHCGLSERVVERVD